MRCSLECTAPLAGWGDGCSIKKKTDEKNYKKPGVGETARQRQKVRQRDIKREKEGKRNPGENWRHEIATPGMFHPENYHDHKLRREGGAYGFTVEGVRLEGWSLLRRRSH